VSPPASDKVAPIWYHNWGRDNFFQDDNDRHGKIPRPSKANIKHPDSANSSPGPETLFHKQKSRAPSVASAFGSADSGLSHPPRANTRAKKIIGLSFSQLSEKAHDDEEYGPSSFSSFPKVEEWMAELANLSCEEDDDWARTLGGHASQSTSAIPQTHNICQSPSLGSSPNHSDDPPLMMKGACQPLKPITEIPRSGLFSNHVTTHPYEPNNGIESGSDDYVDESAIDDKDDSIWEDEIEESGKSSVDDKYFQRVDSKVNLTSRRSFITLMKAQSDDRARTLGDHASQL
jgi:hypothetical protein